MLSLNTMPLSFAGNAFAAAPVVSRAAASPVMQSTFDIRAMPGVTAPLGFFDPLGFSQGQSEGRVKFLREVEILMMLDGHPHVIGFVGAHLSESGLNIVQEYAEGGTLQQRLLSRPAHLLAAHEFEEELEQVMDAVPSSAASTYRRPALTFSLTWEPVRVDPAEQAVAALNEATAELTAELTAEVRDEVIAEVTNALLVDAALRNTVSRAITNVTARIAARAAPLAVHAM